MKFDATMMSFQTTLRTLIVEQNNRTITLLSEDQLKLFVEKLQAIAHGLTCYHGNLESIDLAGRSFEAVAAAALHCYYSDLHLTDDLWEYFSTTKEKLLDEHKQKNLVTAEGNEIIPAAYLNLDQNKHLNPWEDTSAVNSQSNMMVLNPESQDEATTESVTETLPQQTTVGRTCE
jgi:hypothetical protein